MNRIAMLALPYSRAELPGWGKLLKMLGVFEDGQWRDAPTRVLRDKFHGFEVNAHLSDWSDRLYYFTRRYYDLESCLLTMALLREGETFVDVGANVGMFTLLAARQVGPRGRVLAFEPNPQVFKELKENVERNHIEQVSLFQLALSDADTVLKLNVLTEHAGLGTLAEIAPQDQSAITATFDVPVKRGDDVLAEPLRGASGEVMIKIDVEGFEEHVLRGLGQTLATRRPALVAEVIPSHLARAGSTPEALLEIMAKHGYAAYGFGVKRAGLKHRLTIHALADGEAADARNVLWLHPSGKHVERVQPYLTLTQKPRVTVTTNVPASENAAGR